MEEQRPSLSSQIHTQPLSGYARKHRGLAQIMNRKNAYGFTLMEVVVAMLLVTVVGASIFTAFVNASRWASPSELAAIYDARGKVDQLYESVRQDTWGGGGSALSPGTYTATVTIDGRVYTQTYVVTSVSLDGVNEAYRKVVVTDSWID